MQLQYSMHPHPKSWSWSAMKLFSLRMSWAEVRPTRKPIVKIPIAHINVNDQPFGRDNTRFQDKHDIKNEDDEAGDEDTRVVLSIVFRPPKHLQCENEKRQIHWRGPFDLSNAIRGTSHFPFQFISHERRAIVHNRIMRSSLKFVTLETFPTTLSPKWNLKWWSLNLWLQVEMNPRAHGQKRKLDEGLWSTKSRVVTRCPSCQVQSWIQMFKSLKLHQPLDVVLQDIKVKLTDKFIECKFKTRLGNFVHQH